MYMSQEMPNLWRFLARFLLSDNQMTIILEIIFMCFLICRRTISFCIKKFYLSHVIYKFVIFIIINIEKFFYCRSQ